MTKLTIECSEFQALNFISFMKLIKDNDPKFSNKRVTYADTLEFLMSVADAEIESRGELLFNNS